MNYSDRNQGRKPIADKIVQIPVGIRESIKELIPEVQQMMKEAVKWTGQLETNDGRIMKIWLNAEMKQTLVETDGGPIETIDLTRQSDKLGFRYQGSFFYISQFGRVV